MSAQEIINQNKQSRDKTLDLGNCGLTELPDLSGMDWLETLILSSSWREFDAEKKQRFNYKSQNSGAPNQFKKNQPKLPHLPRLKKLIAQNLGISDGRFLEKLMGLSSLDLSDNGISDVRFLEKLTGLRSLSLSKNQISDWRFLEKLTGLSSLDLSSSQISDLEPLLPLIKKGIPVTLEEYGSDINLYNSPLTNPPAAIVEQGNAAILEYFRQKEKVGSKPLLEAKMVLLGDGRAGKTSLACRMLGRELPRQEDRTQGVDIVIGEYRFPVEEGEFVLHIWDFAGQDKYKPLHQFFYTEGAVYVMVADSGNARTDFADWFETTQMFGGEGSPLLLALNEFREGIGMGSFDEEKWRKQFPKLIKEVRLVNLLSQKGFLELEKDIRHLANQRAHSRILAACVGFVLSLWQRVGVSALFNEFSFSFINLIYQFRLLLFWYISL